MLIRHSRPWITPADIAAVTAAMQSGQLAAGEQVSRFENELGRVARQQGGVATSSGTAALHLALLALGVGEGDEVIIPSYVCAAVLNAVRQVRATPVLCDVDPETGNLDPADARKRFTKHTRAVIVVHLFGHPAELDWVPEVDVPVIEDCAQALGARWKGRPVGSVGAISVFSFYATKVICTGEGGLACSSSPELLDRMRALREYDNRESYEVRYNYKMSDLQASLGIAQLARLPEMLERRRALAARYGAALADSGAQLPPRRYDCEPIFYRYVVQTKKARAALPRFAAQSIECKRPVFRPLHHYLNGQAPSLPGADAIYARAVSLPLYPALEEEQVDQVIEASRRVLGRANLAARPSVAIATRSYHAAA